MFNREHRTLAFVPRWTIVRVNRRQSVAEHSYFVALYAFEIAKFLNIPVVYEELMAYALTHDLDEIVTGDINSPTKHALGADRKAELGIWIDRKMVERSDEDSAWAMAKGGSNTRAVVKLADIVEGILYLAGEVSQGNTNVEPNIEYMFRALEKFLESNDAEPLRGDKLSELRQKIGLAYELERRSHDKVVRE